MMNRRGLFAAVFGAVAAVFAPRKASGVGGGLCLTMEPTKLQPIATQVESFTDCTSWDVPPIDLVQLPKVVIANGADGVRMWTIESQG